MDPKSVVGGGFKRKSTCPFGEGFYSKIAKLMVSKEADSLEELRKIAQMVRDSKKSADEELWDSGDDMSAGTNYDFLKAPLQKKTAPDRVRVITAPPLGRKGAVMQPPAPKNSKAAEPTKKKDEVIAPAPLGLDEEDSSSSEKDKACFKCKSNSTVLDNALLTCGHCSTSFHQRCHSPAIDAKQASDPEFFFLCSSCNAQTRPKSRSASPKPSSVTKKEEKPKMKVPDTLSAEFEKFRKKNMQRLTKK